MSQNVTRMRVCVCLKQPKKVSRIAMCKQAFKLQNVILFFRKKSVIMAEEVKGETVSEEMILDILVSISPSFYRQLLHQYIYTDFCGTLCRA